MIFKPSIAPLLPWVTRTWKNVTYWDFLDIDTELCPVGVTWVSHKCKLAGGKKNSLSTYPYWLLITDYWFSIGDININHLRDLDDAKACYRFSFTDPWFLPWLHNLVVVMLEHHNIVKTKITKRQHGGPNPIVEVGEESFMFLCWFLGRKWPPMRLEITP